MANNRGTSEHTSCFYKKATTVICAFNLIAFLYVFHCLISPLYLYSTASSSLQVVRYAWREPPVKVTEVESARIKEAYEARRALEPLELIKRVKEIQEESSVDVSKDKESTALRKKLTAELAERLKSLKGGTSKANQQALEEWRRKKLEARLHELNEASSRDKNETLIAERKVLFRARRRHRISTKEAS